MWMDSGLDYDEEFDTIAKSFKSSYFQDFQISNKYFQFHFFIKTFNCDYQPLRALTQ